jgi:hypothetical protein
MEQDSGEPRHEAVKLRVVKFLDVIGRLSEIKQEPTKQQHLVSYNISYMSWGKS